tara:strand:+ start:665 stop:928 length:264 start_codon:yes stop_codon:yes gene_type:complete
MEDTATTTVWTLTSFKVDESHESVTGWQILDSEGSVHSQHWSREDALGIAAISADDNEALAAELHGQADDAQEITDGLRGLIDREEA